MKHLFPVADRFKARGTVMDIREYGKGNVHDTFLVSLDSEKKEQFILQRINTRVFPRPEIIMGNMQKVTEHVRDRLERTPLPVDRKWVVPRVLLTLDGRNLWVDPRGRFWRAMSFIGDSRSFDTIQDAEHAREVGYALAMFHSLVSDLPAESLGDTLEGFHVTPGYLCHFDKVLKRKNLERHSSEVNFALKFVREHRACAPVLEDARAQGRLRLRPIHGDPKVNNVMIEDSSRRAISIVDLDTVKPGLIHYDIGDCLRSSCNPLGEETENWESVRFDPDLCGTMLGSYLPLARHFLAENDYAYLYDAIHLIAFELGLRFLTDYLQGDVYFKVRHPEHNLLRALVQFKLAESIESQAGAIRSIIAGV